MSAAQFGIANEVNCWNYSDEIGRIRNDWALNAAIARGGLGNRTKDSAYHEVNLDERGEPLTGARANRITFPAGRLPPVGAFWSMTAYDQNKFDLMENPIRRYSLGDRTPRLQPAAAGSLTIAIQATEQGIRPWRRTGCRWAGARSTLSCAATTPTRESRRQSWRRRR